MIIPIYAAVVGLLVGQVVGQAALSPCAAGCVSGVLADTAKMGCAVGDTACVCSYVGDVTDGVHDCVVQACASEGAEQITLAQQSAKDQCAAVAKPAASTTTSPAEAPTTSPPAAASPTSTPADTTTTQPESTSKADSTTATAESTSTAGPTSTPQPTSTTATTLETSSASSSASSTSASTSASSSTSTSATTSTTSSTTQSSGGAAQTGESSQDQGETIGPSGLSVAAKAGIGAGVGVALIMTGIVAICLTVRRKQKENDARRGNMIDISGPLPGGGRQWANEEGKYGTTATVGVRGSYSSELDRHARPYEEMVPHMQPRNMI